MLVAECIEADVQNVEESSKSCRSVWFPEPNCCWRTQVYKQESYASENT